MGAKGSGRKDREADGSGAEDESLAYARRQERIADLARASLEGAALDALFLDADDEVLLVEVFDVLALLVGHEHGEHHVLGARALGEGRGFLGSLGLSLGLSLSRLRQDEDA